MSFGWVVRTPSATLCWSTFEQLTYSQGMLWGPQEARIRDVRRILASLLRVGARVGRTVDHVFEYNQHWVGARVGGSLVNKQPGRRRVTSPDSSDRIVQAVIHYLARSYTAISQMISWHARETKLLSLFTPESRALARVRWPTIPSSVKRVGGCKIESLILIGHE